MQFYSREPGAPVASNTGGAHALTPGRNHRHAAILEIKAARKGGPRRLRRIAQACRRAGFHGADEWSYLAHAGDAASAARDFTKPRNSARYDRARSLIEAAYYDGARARGRAVADAEVAARLPVKDLALSAQACEVAEAVALSAYLNPPEIVEVVVDAFAAVGVTLKAWLRQAVGERAQHAIARRPSRLALAPVSAASNDDAAGEAPSDAATLDPFAFGNLPGLLGDVARWSHGFAFKPVPEFAVASALAAMSVLFGRRFTTPTNLGLNVYIVGIAPTGGGKEAALAAPQALLDEAGFGFLLGPNDFASDSAIEVSLRSRPCQMMTLDEFGQLLGAVQGKNAPQHAKLARKALLETFTKSGPGGRWTGKARASDDFDKASSPIYSPTLTLLACSTIEGFFEGLTESNLGDGFVNRLTVVRAKAVGARNMDPSRTVIPEALVLAVRDAYDASKAEQGNMPRLPGDKPALRAVPWADEAARAAWLAVADWEDAERERTPGRDGVVGRAAEQTLKFATLAALARDPGQPTVTADDVRWAEALVRTSIDTLDEGVSQNMAGSEFEALVKAIERALRASKYGGLPMSQLLRCKGVSKADPRTVDAALKRLEQTNIIKREIGAADGGPPRNSVTLREWVA